MRMSERLVVAAHGFRGIGPSIPTHVHDEAFFAWANECQKRVGGFGDASEFVRSLRGIAGSALEDSRSLRSPVLTFDDALVSIERVADSIPVPSILFVVVDHVGRFNDWPSQPAWVPRERCLSWSRIRALADKGWLIGAHSMDHPCLGRCSASEQRDQIETSKKTIEDRVGKPCNLFAFPYGDAPVTARRIVEESGMIGFGTNPGIANPRSDRACLPRVDLFDLVRPGIAAGWAWSHPGAADVFALRIKRALGRYRPGRRAA